MHIRYILIPVFLYFSIRVFAEDKVKPMFLAASKTDHVLAFVKNPDETNLRNK